MAEINKLDKSFKTLINKRFSTDSRLFYAEKGSNTLNIHSSEIWTDSLNADPNISITNGSAVIYNKYILTPDPVYPTKAFFFMKSMGTFTAGSSTYDIGITNNAQQINFISDKYGANYEVKLYDYNKNQIGKTDPIGWIFDYVTGTLSIAQPGSYVTPYRVTVYQYIGNTLQSMSNDYSETFVTILNQTNFTLTNTCTKASQSKLFINGEKMTYGIEYTITNSIIVYSPTRFSLDTNDKLQIYYS